MLGALWCYIVVVLDRFGIPPVPWRICRVVVWSILCLLQVRILVEGRGPVFLGGRDMYQGRSMSRRWPQICLHCR